MRLVKLSIFKTNGILKDLNTTEIIREVSFKDNLNIITDDGNKKGNTVGKTTFLQLIDLCLGGSSIDIIYKNNHIKNEDNPIKSFIEQNFVAVSLEFNGGIIIRPLFDKNKIILNDELLSLHSFNERMLLQVFNIRGNKPSFRQLIQKFIRITPSAIESVLNFNHSSTKQNDHLAIRRVLFGYPDIKNTQIKQGIHKQIKDLKNKYKLLSDIKPKQLEQNIVVAKNQIEGFDKERKNLNLADDIENLIKENSELNTEYVNINNELDNINFIITRMNESIKLLENKKSDINTSVLTRLYSEASNLLNASRLPKTFEELVEFHNLSIDNEQKFIQSQYDETLEKKAEIEEQIKILSENKISLQLASKFNEIADKLAIVNQDLGKNIQLKEQYDKYQQSLASLEKELSKYPDTKNMHKIFDENLTAFNLIFASVYDKMFDKKASNIYSDDVVGVKLETDKEKSGTGEQIGEVVAFDLSYMIFTHEKNISYPRFQIQDRLEMTDIKPKSIAFNDIIPKSNCQYIIATLNSSIAEGMGKDFLDKNTILKLSQTDKLFKI